MTPIILSTTKPGVQLSNPLLNISMLNMSSPISTIINPDSDITRYLETNYDILLHTQARQHGAMLYEADYTLTRAISYPHWEREWGVPIWIIDPKLMKIREEYPSELPKLEAKNLPHLCNEDLVEHFNGFELHSACGL
jgi:hypothetical protein